MASEITFSKKARKVSGNIVITIPKEVCETLEIESGDMIQATIKKVS